MKAVGRIALILLAALIALSAGCAGNGGKNGSNEYAVKDEKLREAVPAEGQERVFYEIFVGSFSDHDGDGTGDLRGIIDRMDYINDGDPASGRSLGVQGLWLTPIFRSSSYHKYDVNDYYTVDPAFGTEEDLKELISLCHDRGVYLILDLPINHTGKLNDWFSKFVVAHRSGDTANEYYDVYTWYDGAKEAAPAGRVFEKIAGTEHYYECNFSSDMPELNFDNELAKKLVLEVAEHYLDMGVDGFRFDAAKYVFFGDHKKSVDFWKWYMGELRSKKPDVYAVAEVWDGDGITDMYMETVNCFDFAISETSGLISEIAHKGDANRFTGYIEQYLNKVKSVRSEATITPFITNHDMDRAAGFLPVSGGFMQMAANLYILGPGTPFIYYGEELGVRGSRGGSNTDANRRLAMPWGDEDNVKDPAGASYDQSKRIESTALDQIADENSLYTYYKKLIMARSANPEIARGEYRALKLAGTKVGGFTSTLDGSTVVVLHNPSGSSQTIDLSALPVSVSELRAVIGMESAELNGSELKLGAQTSVILK